MLSFAPIGIVAVVVALFVPFRFLIPLVFIKLNRVSRIIPLGFAVRLLVESAQFLISFLFDIFFAVYEMLVGYLTATIVEENTYAIFPAGARYLSVDDLYIQRKYRSLGIGSELLQLCEQKARQDGILYFFVSSAAKDADAIRKFYSDTGYRIFSNFNDRLGGSSPCCRN